MKKRLIALICMLLMATGVLSACSDNGSSDDDKINVVCTIFPQYDWVKSIVGDSDDVEITLLLDNGVDLHSYQPSADDIAKIAACDVFIYVGGESDGWVEDALTKSVNDDMKVINMMDVLGSNVKEEEVVEGMQAEEEEEDADQEEEEVEYDEHVWLSLKNAKTICKSIEEAISAVDTQNAETYKANYETYLASLDELDTEYSEAVSNASLKTVLFGDRFPFRYLVDDYGLDYYAAFVGCSAETEASFETIVFLAGKLDELKLPAVLVIEGSQHKIAETIVSNSTDKDQDILVMNSLQSVTSTDVENGTTYLGIMKDNLEVLKQALN